MKLLDIIKEEFKHSNHVDITDKLYDILYNQADDFIGKGIDYTQRSKKFEDAISKYIIYSKTDKEKQQAKKQIDTELNSMIKSYKKDVADKVNKLFKSIDKEVSNIKKHTK